MALNYFYSFFQDIPPQRPVSGTALSLQEIIIVGNCEKQVNGKYSFSHYFR